LLESLRSGELHGLNVTIPHKQAVLALLDELSPAASAIGAANTLYRAGGRLYGDNTDAPGFLADLHARFSDLPAHDGRALVLGAGGSARAVVYALAGSGWQVTVAARRVEQALALVDSLAGSLPVGSLRGCSLTATALIDFMPIDLLVNSTPLGMTPAIESNPWPAELPLSNCACVYDLVYNPRETRLVQAARRDGLPAACGIGMLVEQAALSLERWTGLPLSREVMFHALEDPA
jgi:shikimate dehydrogenase